MDGAPPTDRFSRFIAIDWSGAKGTRHPGIAVASCETGDTAPRLIAPPGRYWSRRDVLDWLRGLSGDVLIGFDFSFAPPFVERRAYLPGADVPDEARAFWAHVDACCADDDLGAASFVEQQYRAHFYLGAADGPKADFMHLRQCEAHFNAGGGGKPSTIYDAIGAAQVSKASFAGMRLLHHVQECLTVWPFNPVPETGPLIVEIYTSIAARAGGRPKGRSKMRDGPSLDSALARLGSQPHLPLNAYSDHATDAILASAWLRMAASDPSLWVPAKLTQEIARTEGWTFGVI